MIFFIRHNRLISPYDDYNKLNFNDLVDLSSQKISPNISDKFSKNYIINKINELSIDLIYTSQLERTQESSKLLGFDKYIIIKELNEILFNVKDLLTEDEYKNYGLSIVRERLWQKLFLKKKGVEKLENLNLRLNNIIEIINKNPKKNILFITHGFLILLIRLKLNNVDILNINFDDFKSFNLSPIDYLDGFYFEN